MKLLESELIRKYFGVFYCKEPHVGMGHGGPCGLNPEATALRILEAMEANLVTGQKILSRTSDDCEWQETVLHGSTYVGQSTQFHPLVLVLPDAFQVYEKYDKITQAVKKLEEASQCLKEFTNTKE